jgi:PAS domain S-box-containing protein
MSLLRSLQFFLGATIFTLLITIELAWRGADMAPRERLLLSLIAILSGCVAVVLAWTAIVGYSSYKRLGDAVAERDRLSTMLLEGTPDYALLLLDPRGEVVRWNRGAEILTGAPSADAVGRNIASFYSPLDQSRGRPEEVLRIAATIGRYENLRVRIEKNGTRYDTASTYTALRSADGTLLGFTVVGRDLGEGEETGARYRGLLEAAPDAMVVVDQKGNVVILNLQTEKQFGYTRDELIGQPVTNIIPIGFAERLIADGTRTASEAMAQQIGTGIELIGRRKDGTEFPIEIMLSPLENADGTLVTAAIRNISVRTAADRHLAQMEGRYRGLLEAAPDAMVVVDESGNIVLLNVQAEKQFGYSRDTLLGQPVKNIIPEGFAERLIADGTRTAKEALAQQIGTGIELIGLRQDGTEFPIEIMLSPLENADGTLVTAAIRDISVRTAADQHLAQMERRYRGLLEAAPDAMVVVDPSGDIVLLNVQAEKQFGYRRDELIGQPVKNIIPEGFAERLIADGSRTAAEAYAQQIGTGIELNGRRKDGTEFPIEIMLSPLENAEGILVTAAIRDISVRRAADKHLAQMESRYRGLLEAAPDAMVVVNSDWEIVLLNVQAEKQFGYSRNELLGQKVKNIIPAGFAERLIADALRTTEDALAQQIGTGIELTGRRKDKTEFPIEIMLSPLENTDGILVTAAIRNITLRKKAEQELVQKIDALNRSNEELGQFAYVASHDLQEPLRMVASYTQLLSKRYKGRLDSDADEFIAFAVDGASRMQRLIQDLLTFSRVGTKIEKLETISSEDALKEALRNLRGAIEDSGATVTHDPLPAILADEMQLVQLFQNLVGNGIKYQNSSTPHIHVSSKKSGEKSWEFTVTDDGLGIAPQYFDRIFGMFQRLHKREDFAGTGIGLAVCKKIVERHGGTITVESQLGLGSTFRFTLSGEERKL